MLTCNPICITNLTDHHFNAILQLEIKASARHCCTLVYMLKVDACIDICWLTSVQRLLAECNFCPFASNRSVHACPCTGPCKHNRVTASVGTASSSRCHLQHRCKLLLGLHALGTLVRAAGSSIHNGAAAAIGTTSPWCSHRHDKASGMAQCLQNELARVQSAGASSDCSNMP